MALRLSFGLLSAAFIFVTTTLAEAAPKVNCDVNACISYCQKRNPQGASGQACNSGCMITMEERKKKGQCK